jgi:hypothetical protein
VTQLSLEGLIVSHTVVIDCVSILDVRSARKDQHASVSLTAEDGVAPFWAAIRAPGTSTFAPLTVVENVVQLMGAASPLWVDRVYALVTAEAGDAPLMDVTNRPSRPPSFVSNMVEARHASMAGARKLPEAARPIAQLMVEGFAANWRVAIA